ncbi:MAG: hypothetical protein ACOCQR_02405 [bacterium]
MIALEKPKFEKIHFDVDKHSNVVFICLKRDLKGAKSIAGKEKELFADELEQTVGFKNIKVVQRDNQETLIVCYVRDNRQRVHAIIERIVKVFNLDSIDYGKIKMGVRDNDFYSGELS